MALSKKPSQPNTPLNSAELFTFISGLAQELQGPLHTVADRTQKIIDDYKKKDFEYISYKDFKNILKTLEQINDQLKRCSATTERMIHLNNSKSLIEEQGCQVNDVIKDMVVLLSQQLEQGKLTVRHRLGKDLPLIAVGPVECHQIINNVLVNAIQSMPAGGVIKIRTFLDKAGKFVVVEVEDQGVGITPEHLSKVFEPFFTTKERGIEKSAGLGLSIVYSIVNAVGGSINIKSSLRKGTCVHIALPVVA